MHGFGWHMGGMWFWWIFLIVAVIAVAWYIVRSPSLNKTGTKKKAEETLKERYARGDIGHDTYNSMLSDLRE